MKEHYSVCSIKLHANDHCCFADVFHISTLSDNTARLTTACVCGGAIQALYHYNFYGLNGAVLEASTR